MSLVQRFISSQLARPSGLFGRFITYRWLEKANVAMNRLTLECLALGEDDELLEIGFGSGYLLAEVLRERLCRTVCGIDISKEMVDAAVKRLSRIVGGREFDIRVADIAKLPFAEGRFSRLCSVNTLYFWPDPAAALAECRRVLQTGGRLVICFDAKESLLDWPGHRYGFALYEVSEVERLLRSAGFDELRLSEGFTPGQGKFYCLAGVAS